MRSLANWGRGQNEEGSTDYAVIAPAIQPVGPGGAEDLLGHRACGVAAGFR